MYVAAAVLIGDEYDPSVSYLACQVAFTSSCCSPSFWSLSLNCDVDDGVSAGEIEKLMQWR